ncbi:type II toxin-antitoxin system RelE/ParE family toxin [Caulobacter endophyticus]|uniref:Plasmid stabilization protein n=1 Tax=Caulobacter endophyticus TaxID=2172652 RepID=A0A2T9K0M4_9CAUL|nr:type II toxin-antitoxin system RelE/ParE family toxin [Caulobacter endophyticus]PVM89516.1 plasmid stabilization protein [Caulobacter endophyticus]
MSFKPVIPRTEAEADVEAAVSWYLSQAGVTTALSFAEAMYEAYRIIGERSAAGYAAYAYILKRPGLRTWQLKRYPYLIFYFERNEHVDVWRVLHGQRDLPAGMQDV